MHILYLYIHKVHTYTHIYIHTSPLVLAELTSPVASISIASAFGRSWHSMVLDASLGDIFGWVKGPSSI